ncbi:KE2 family protein [Trichomonas vaginalis G3]|uniref:KE2 family protein n=1 Tax=Trichomonas vaginalis (strain ATCC PRA-98 / G3) TaxID=412133 RepID=A2FTU6_TRIV3|nr:prefoldin family [Trichomonas vaginalis G3]EAX91667.1 KE2 family protein [Trichomonas vaginalis G3]KAI5487245.1 prefoldin family [Trichomonas vaginalis G3]|eukprot:XP_001304597.1 KE2 family protein [Trichomonas vaginalis G3]
MTQPPINIRDIEEASKKIEMLRTKLQTLNEQRGQAFFQLRECTLVQEELKELDDTDVIMKLSGPTLIQADLISATENVKQRLQFIENQIKSIDKQIDDTNAELATAEDVLRKVGAGQ